MKRMLALLENICAVCLCILTFSVFFQILARLVLQIPATWTVEVGRAMFLLIVFLGMPILIYTESQMTVTMIKDLFRKNRPATLVFDVVEDIFAYFFLVTLIYGSYDRTLNEWGTVIPTLTWVTYGHLYLAMLIGSICMLIAKVAHTRNYLAGKDRKEED